MSDFRLKVFCSVARNLSFTKASQELFISQPAISKHIRELEVKYNTRLFDRLGGKISLTPSARLLLEHSEAILAEYARLDYEMHLLNNEYSGELRLGASTTIAQYVLPPLLARFAEKFPNVRLTLFNSNSEEVERALQEHRIDIGLVEGNVRRPDLKYSLFLKDELVCVVAPRDRWKNCDEMTIEEFRQVPLVLRERGSGTLDVLTSALEKCGVRLSDLRVAMFLGSTESIKLYLKNSECMGVVSVRSIADELYSGRFKVIDVEGLDMNREFNFVQLHGQESGLSAVFMNFAFHYNNKL